MKFLLIPGNNALPHVAECLALEIELNARGHQVLIAVTKKTQQLSLSTAEKARLVARYPGSR